MDISKIKSNIRAMLNLAADAACSPNEKEQAMRKVTQLMDEYNLREEDVADADGILDSLDNVEVGKAKVDVGKQECSWMRGLCNFVELLLGTVQSYSVREKEGTRCIFYGVLADCEIAAEIYYETRDFIETACGTKYEGSTRRGDGFSYCLGFVAGLTDQLEKVKSATAPASTALVVKRNAIVAKKQDLATQWIKDQGVKLRSVRPRVSIKEDPFANGFKDGARHGVNPDRRKKLTT
jgi:hypothetical protein